MAVAGRNERQPYFVERYLHLELHPAGQTLFIYYCVHWSRGSVYLDEDKPAGT
jgi:hypothetical protein